MRIVVDLRSLSGSPWSGVPMYTREIVSALTALRSEHEWTGYTSGRSAGSVSVGSIQQYWHGPFSNAFSTLLWNLPRSRFRNPPRANVFFLPNWNILPARLPFPLVVTLHDCSAQRLAFDGGLKRRLWHKAIRIPRLLHQAHALICVSESTAQEVRTFFPEEQKKIHVIPLVPPTRRVHECGGICSLWTQEKKPIVVLLSDGHRRKNIDAALKALSRMRTPHVLVQVGSPAVGPLEPLRFDALLSHAALLVYPSIYEGFGFPPQEAIARGIPVIAGSSPAVAEVSGERCTLVNPLDVAQMERVIEEVLRQGAKPNTKAPSAPQRTWAQVAQETFAVLEAAGGK